MRFHRKAKHKLDYRAPLNAVEGGVEVKVGARLKDKDKDKDKAESKPEPKPEPEPSELEVAELGESLARYTI